MGPTWVLSAPDGPHICPMNLAIRNGACHPRGGNPLKDFCVMMGPRVYLQYKDHLSRYRDSHCKDKVFVRLTYLYNGDSYIDDMVSLY